MTNFKIKRRREKDREFKNIRSCPGSNRGYSEFQESEPNVITTTLQNRAKLDKTTQYIDHNIVSSIPKATTPQIRLDWDNPNFLGEARSTMFSFFGNL